MKAKLKALIKKFLARIIGRPVHKAIKQAERAQIISFDVFDTLIFRKCLPAEVFSLAGEALNVKDFREHRTAAERRARINTSKGEINLDEIYQEISKEYGKDFADKMKTVELDTEFKVIYQNAEMKKFFDSMKAKGKRIIITSDMYLPARIISKMLTACGYDGYEKLYVSSEYRAKKSDGKIFRKIISELKINPLEILHIGDNIKSDYFMAKKENWRAFLYKK